MSLLPPLGLRARLAVALVALAVLAVAIATLLSHSGLEPRLSAAAEDRLDTDASRLAEAAATTYETEGAWTDNGIHTLEHLALLGGFALTLKSADGALLTESEPDEVSELQATSGVAAEAPVVVGGEGVGTIVISPLGGSLLGPEDARLRRSLDRLDLAAAGIAVAAALVLAFLLAVTLARPLRRIREAAGRLASGELSTRVAPEGGPELRALAEALNRLAETLEQEEQLRKASLADLAHELRTPVSGLLARIEAAQDGVFESSHDNLVRMHEEALRLTRLIEDLARLAEAERPALLVERRPVDLAEVARAAAAAVEPGFRERQLDLRILADEEVLVAGDPDRLAQIAQNLLSNGLRYTEPGGHVTIRVARTGQTAILEVADTGIGIPPEDVPHVFERFWRGEKSRSRATGGAGIGLTIVRELARAHDGHIELDSAVGEGTRFRVLLPVLASVADRRGGTVSARGDFAATSRSAASSSR